MDETYHYSPLTSSRSIRTVVLEGAAQKTAQLRCSLIDVDLDNPASHEYEALSYVWGSPDPPYEIVCSGKSINITGNCASALRNLRLKSRERILWIDAICIDQSSTAERNSQVSMMGEIYGKASTTLAWLGEGDPQSRPIFKFLTRYLLLNGPRRSSTMYNGVLTGIRRLRTYFVPPHQASTAFEKASKVCRNVYFSRMWTVQEIALSKKCVVVWGSESLEWRIIGNAVQLIFDYEAESDQDTRSLDAFIAHWFAWCHVTSPGVSDEGWDLEDFLQLVRSKQATDPRDKIYAIHSLMPHFSVTLPSPDYTNSISRVYTDATIAVMKQTQSIELLYAITGDTRRSDLPSWVPDWSDTKAVFTMYHEQYNASSTSDKMAQFSSEQHEIIIRGLSISTVARKGIHVPTTELQDENGNWTDRKRDELPQVVKASVLFSTWLGLMRKSLPELDCASMREVLFKVIKSRQSYNDDEDLWSTLEFKSEVWTRWYDIISASTSQSLESYVPPDAEIANQLESLLPLESDPMMLPKLKALISDHSDAKEAKDLQQNLLDFVHNQALFITTDQRVGMGYHGLNMGDEVLILEGTQMPFLARSLPDREGGKYALVTPVYISGVMDGELWPVDEEQLKTFTFV